MFGDHGKQDNSLFSFYSKKNKHLEVCRRIIYPEYKEAFCHVRYFLHQIQDF